MSEKSRLGGNVAANLFQVIASAVLLFFLYRYINITLGPDALGVWSVVLATASASRLTDLGLSASVARFVAKYLARKEPSIAARVVETALISLVAISSIALSLLYWLLWFVLSYIFNGNHLADARALLPYALLSLWLSVIAITAQSGLDGCQRMRDRAILVISAQVLMIALAMALIPINGLIGLAWAQIGHAIFLILFGWYLLKRRLSLLGWIPTHWSWGLFKEMVGYGANIQAATLFMLLLDPFTKAMMAKFGGATAAGYFEMANQVVIKIRGLIVSANQAIVPHVASMSETIPDGIPELYQRNFRLIFLINLPGFSIIYAWSGILSVGLVDDINSVLVVFLQLSCMAWFINSFSGPAYFFNLGTGKIGWNTISHVLMGMLNVGLGAVGGSVFGMMGVAWAYCISIISGSVLLIWIYHNELEVSIIKPILSESNLVVLLTTLLVVVGHFTWTENRDPKYYWVIAIALITLLMLIVTWRHPLSRSYMSGLLSRMRIVDRL